MYDCLVDYQRRILDDQLDELFPHIPAIAIDGVKAVGKSTTAEQRVRSVVNLDVMGRREAVLADPESILLRETPLFVDEWQKVPAVWDTIRRAVDRDPSGGRFLLAGSASPAPGATAHSGAGRIGRLRMRPMTLSERGHHTAVSLAELLNGGARVAGSSDLRLVDYAREIVNTGFPAMRGLPDGPRKFQLDSYLHNVVDRDVAEAGLAVRRPDALLRWLRAYSAASATTANYAQILDAATPSESEKPARSTSVAYREVLTQLWLLDPIPAWQPMGSALNRLQQAPKHHLADPGLAARLLGLTVDSLVDGQGSIVGAQSGTMLGHLFESLAALCVRVAASAAGAAIGHLRTRNGDHEIDMVVVRDDGHVLPIEVKLSSTVGDSDTRHLRWLAERLGDKVIDKIILNTGPEAYRRRDGVAVIPLSLLGP